MKKRTLVFTLLFGFVFASSDALSATGTVVAPAPAVSAADAEQTSASESDLNTVPRIATCHEGHEPSEATGVAVDIESPAAPATPAGAALEGAIEASQQVATEREDSLNFAAVTTVTPAECNGQETQAGEQQSGSSAATAHQTPAGQAAGSASRTIVEASSIADYARGEEIIQSGQALRLGIERDARTDHSQISQRYSQISPEQMQERLTRASQSLREESSVLMSAASSAGTGGTANSLDRSDLVRFALKQNQGADLAQALGSVIQDSLRDQAGVSQFNLIGGGSQGAATGGALLQAPSLVQNAQSRGDLLKTLFGQAAQAEAAPTNDGLVFRNVLYSGLTSSERDMLRSRLKLTEMVDVKQGDGPAKKITVLHNGYILGAGKTGTDCSAFVTRALPPEVRQARFTTLDFKMMWLFAKRSDFPRPPIYDKVREGIVKRVSDSFVPVDVTSGDHLKTGDLLVYRLLDKPIGHVFLVRSYNPRDLTVEVIEASQSAGTIRERKFYMSVYPESAKVRPVRAGLFALRLKPLNNAGCKYKEPKRRGFSKF